MVWPRFKGRPGPEGFPPDTSVVWAARSRPRSHFLARVTRLEGEAAAAHKAVLQAGLRLLGLGPGDPRLYARVAVRRVLADGQELHSELRLQVEPQGTPGRMSVELDVERESAAALCYRVLLENGAVLKAEMSSPPGVDAMALPTAGADFPVGIGDLQVQDARLLWESLDPGRLEPLGYLQEEGSRRLLVVEAQGRRPPGNATVARDQAQGRERALLYLEPPTNRVQAVRVFDAKDRLVRVYEDFAYDEDKASVIPARFRVTSIPTDSHSVFQVRSVKQGGE